MWDDFNDTLDKMGDSLQSGMNGLGGVMDNFSTGFGSGLNLISGAFGIGKAFLQNQITEDQLQADEGQINLSLQQNKLGYIQRIGANSMKMASVLGANRAKGAGQGITMDSGTFTQMLTRNLSAYGADNFAQFANYTLNKENLEERRKADEQKASDEEEGGIFDAISSFFK